MSKKTYRKAFEKTFKQSAIDKFFDEHYKWKAAREKHREAKFRLRREAHKEFLTEHRKWFKTLDTIGIILIVMNLLALVITGLLVVQAEPSKSFVEGNPTQCAWNGWACHPNAGAVLTPLLRQIFIWAILVTLYVFARTYTFTTTGMWMLTAVIILYASLISIDTLHDVGLYLGKLLFGVIA